MLPNVFLQIDGEGISRLRQDYPEPTPSTVFHGFDYNTKPYADVLDSIATIFIIWISTSILTRLLFAFSGRDTRSLAIKELLDRFMNINIAPFWSRWKQTLEPVEINVRRNFSLKLISFFFFVTFIGVEACVILSQSASYRYIDLDDLKLKSIRFSIPPSVENRGLSIRSGCVPLVKQMPLNDIIPLYICLSSDLLELNFNPPADRFQIAFNNSDTHFHVIVPVTSDYSMRFFISVQFQDKLSSTTYFANLTQWGVHMSMTLQSWLAEAVKKKFGYRSLVFEEDGLMGLSTPVSSPENKKLLQDFIINHLLYLLEVSETDIKGSTFIIRDSMDTGKVSVAVARTTRTRVKRLSGTILWVVIIGLGIVKLVIDYITWDIDKYMDEMVAEVLNISSSKCLVLGPTVPFKIVSDFDPAVSDLECCGDAQSSRSSSSSSQILRLKTQLYEG